jgi:hypothetical protein
LKIGYIDSLKGEKIIQAAVLGHVFIYVQKTLTHNSLYVVDDWMKILSLKDVQL